MAIDKALNEAPNKRPSKKIKFASDIDKLKFDVESNIIDNLREAYEEEKVPGQTFQDRMNSKDEDYLIRINLKEGGRPIPNPNKDEDVLDKATEVMKIRSQLTPRDNKIIDILIEKSLNLGSKD